MRFLLGNSQETFLPRNQTSEDAFGKALLASGVAPGMAKDSGLGVVS